MFSHLSTPTFLGLGLCPYVWIFIPTSTDSLNQHLNMDNSLSVLEGEKGSIYTSSFSTTCSPILVLLSEVSWKKLSTMKNNWPFITKTLWYLSFLFIFYTICYRFMKISREEKIWALYASQHSISNTVYQGVYEQKNTVEIFLDKALISPYVF